MRVLLCIPLFIVLAGINLTSAEDILCLGPGCPQKPKPKPEPTQHAIEGKGFEIPCSICEGTIDFVKDIISWKNKFTSGWLYGACQDLCGFVASFWEWAGDKCKGFMTKQVTDSIHAWVMHHTDTSRLCGYGSHLIDLVALYNGAPGVVSMDCREGRVKDPKETQSLGIMLQAGDMLNNLLKSEKRNYNY